LLFVGLILLQYKRLPLETELPKGVTNEHGNLFCYAPEPLPALAFDFLPTTAQLKNQTEELQ